ncbi:hypothetical protein ABBQ38_004741, partial [Trebouxia sp. C0009 RCD-2024]
LCHPHKAIQQRGLMSGSEHTVKLVQEHLENSGSYRWLHFRTGRCSQDELTLTAVEVLTHCNNAHLPGCHNMQIQQHFR